MGKERMTRFLGIGLTIALIVACAFGPGQAALRRTKGSATSAASRALPYSPEDIVAFSKRFQTDIWSLLTRKESNCTGCHNATNPSQLHFGKDPDQVFQTLLTDGHLDAENPASLLARLTSPIQATRMPPAPFKPWTDAEIGVLRTFVNDLYARRHKGVDHSDELFPAALLLPYNGKRAPTGQDNTFLTYYQLRNKIKAIFGDDWRRDGKDLFEENLAQFGGADFERSFNESARPTAQFLAGVDAMSQDVASHAYLTGSGPFAGHVDLPSPLKMAAPNVAYRREINRLYRGMLFRDANAAEMQSSFRLLKDIYRAQPEIAAQDYTLRFELTARDEHGLTTTQECSLHVANDAYGLSQTLVNEDDTSGSDDKALLIRRKLDGPFTFKANDPEQRVTVSNIATHGDVVVHALEVRGPLPNGPTRVIAINDPSVQPQGAWRLTNRSGVACYEDENQNKGDSSLIFPVNVTQDGQYELSLVWRKAEDRAANADNVLAEVHSHDKSRLAVPTSAPIPPKGQADFTMDQSDDTISFWDPQTIFQFGPDDGVEISNAGTRRRVVADAVRFVPVSLPGVQTVAGATEFMVPAKDAKGQADWKEYARGEYTFYHAIGPRLVSDENDRALKGKLHILYSPSARPTDWKPDSYYHIGIGYPGEARNDTAVPVIIHARASSPIVRVGYPLRAHVSAAVTLDASGSYNLQGTPLAFTWRQIGGAKVTLTDPHAAKLTFPAPTMTAQQAAWEGLCRALMKHPDFLFTRPLSLATTRDPHTHRRLQLVKIAQDLVARTPTAAELHKLDAGAPLSALVDGYLNSQEFADFYFRRIRLYLESHGTDEEDEPARLWSYIALHDRPFKEILTADYTVDANGQRQPRPAYCGKSGVLTMKGFIKGKPGLPHFNYAAQVCEKFLGYVFEVPPEIVKMRDGITAASTTSPSSVCYSCHKILTPLAYQRSRWTDNGDYKSKDDSGQLIDDSDHQLVPSYAFRGDGMEAFALQVQNKERFIRTMIQTHFIFYFGQEMRCERDERGLYKRLWDIEHKNNYSLKGLIRALVTSPEYLNAGTSLAPSGVPSRPPSHPRHLARAE
jgi:hypothetical protein